MNFDSTSIDIECPTCLQQFSEQIGRLKQNPTLNCPVCQQPIRIDATGLSQGLQSVENQLDDLSRALKKLGKR